MKEEHGWMGYLNPLEPFQNARPGAYITVLTIRCAVALIGLPGGCIQFGVIWAPVIAMDIDGTIQQTRLGARVTTRDTDSDN